MDFEGQYLTYEDYKALGGTLDLAPFNLLEFEARRKIDIRTQSRLKKITDYDDMIEEVKICMFKLINTMENYEKSLESASKSSAIASESIDGYSISYSSDSNTAQIIKDEDSQLGDIIFTYLTGVVLDGEHLVYLGVE